MTNKSLTLSIIIPAYNEERHLKACLDSIAAQTVKPDEVIVVDNGSSDNTPKIAGSYKFVRLLTEKKKGVVFARDKGFNSAKSVLIGRIDADTILPADWVERVQEFYKSKNNLNKCLTGGCYFYNVRFQRFGSWWQGQVAFRYNRLLMGHYILFGSNMVVPAKLWGAVKEKVCDDLDVHEDLDLAIHLHRLGYDIVYDESLRVGVLMRRVRSNREELWDNIMWWPKTLRRHGKKTWVFGWAGAVFFYAISPLVNFFERMSRLIGKPPIPEP